MQQSIGNYNKTLGLQTFQSLSLVTVLAGQMILWGWSSQNLQCASDDLQHGTVMTSQTTAGYPPQQGTPHAESCLMGKAEPGAPSDSFASIPLLVKLESQAVWDLV